MPELPEVETVVRQLQDVLPGKVIGFIDVLKSKSMQGQTLQIIGKEVLSVSRKQKIIIMELTGNEVILIHLKMTGQLIYQPNNSLDLRSVSFNKGDALEGRIVGGHPTEDWVGKLPSKHTRVIIHFTDGSTLFFNDQRLFGWVRIVDSVKWKVLSQAMAPDVVDDTFTALYLEKVLKSSRRAIKLVILDQGKVGGMGNIYANDALYIAGIHPNTPSNQFKMHAVIKLYNAMKQVIEAGIQAGGASYSHFVDAKGLGGHYQDQFQVYGREGEECYACHSVIRKISLGGRGTYYCPHCQSISN